VPSSLKTPSIIIPYNFIPVTIDFSKVTERLYTGGSIVNKKDVKTLKVFGITHILNGMYSNNEKALIESVCRDIVYKWNPTDDDAKPKSTEWFKIAIDFGVKVISNPGFILYVHCAAGVNRGPSMLYAIMRALGYSVQDAVLQIKRSRKCAEIAYLYDAERALKELGWIR
jgi:dual specificity phosphatase 3